MIRIPLNGPYFLNAPDSYLKFETYITNGNTAEIVRLDSSAHTYIQRLRIEGPDGSELERIEDYNVLHAMLLDFQSGDNHNHTSRIYEKVAGRVGMVQQNMQYTTAAGYAVDTKFLADSGNSDKIYQTLDSIESEGDSFFEQPNPVSVDLMQHIGSSNIMTVGLKLVSGLLQNERYLPLLALKGAGLTLELTLASAENCFFSASTNDSSGALPTFTAAVPTYTIQNVEYIAQTIDFDEAFTATFMSMIQVR